MQENNPIEYLIVKCPECEGRGKKWYSWGWCDISGESYDKCRTCEGLGTVRIKKEL